VVPSGIGECYHPTALGGAAEYRGQLLLTKKTKKIEMANKNTLRRRAAGVAGHGKKCGTNVDSHILRKKSGKKPWRPMKVKEGK